MDVTQLQQQALDYFNLDFCESDDPDCKDCWFAYQRHKIHPDYPGTSCECIEDVVKWYQQLNAHLKI